MDRFCWKPNWFCFFKNSNWNSSGVFVCGNFIALNLHFSVKFHATRSRFRYLYEEIKGNNGLWERKAWKSDWAFYNPLTKKHLEDLSPQTSVQAWYTSFVSYKSKNSEDETLLRPCTHATSIAQYQYHANPLGTVKQEFCTLILMS